MSNLYCCYSVPQMKYLTEKGFKYELIAVNPNNGFKFWVYIKNNKLQESLKEWSLGSK